MQFILKPIAMWKCGDVLFNKKHSYFKFVFLDLEFFSTFPICEPNKVHVSTFLINRGFNHIKAYIMLFSNGKKKFLGQQNASFCLIASHLPKSVKQVLFDFV